MTREHCFADRAVLAAALADEVARELGRGVAERGSASLVVSGGSTPGLFFAALSQRSLPWEKVWITLADERWVAVTSVASNEGLVRRMLLVGPAAAAHLVGLKTPAATPQEGEALCERRLAALPRPFDAVVLGMGDDGHTASLFPGAPQLAAALDPAGCRLCLAIDPPAAAPARMSLTVPALLAARRLFLHMTGEGKLALYRRALAAGPVGQLPIRAVLRAPGPGVDVYWAP